MAGGTWTTQNKVRAGAYINFKAAALNATGVGSRGVMTMPVALSWGPQKKVIELLATDLINGNSLKKIGLQVTDDGAQIFRQALAKCYKALIYRMDVGGAKATATSGNLTANAKYPGTFGNNISIQVRDNVTDSTKWDVVTLVNNSEVSVQILGKTTDISTLADNDWVDWSGEGVIEAAVNPTSLTGGTNGNVDNTIYTAADGYLNAVQGLTWNTMAIPQEDTIATSTVKSAVVSFIRNMRDSYGRKVQAVLFAYSGNYEGIISVRQGYSTADETIQPHTFTAYVAGLTAGSEINVSNTYAVIEGATEIVYPTDVTPYTDEDIITQLQNGQFILSVRQDGAIVVEKDINTLHSPYPNNDVNYTFTKNRVIRTLDEINNTISNKFQTTYIGKVSNEDNGRNLFKADIISYLNQLVNMTAITNFDSATDIEVAAGEAVDAVVVNLAIQPVDSMEKLYMTVKVN